MLRVPKHNHETVCNYALVPMSRYYFVRADTVGQQIEHIGSEHFTDMLSINILQSGKAINVLFLC